LWGRNRNDFFLGGPKKGQPKLKPPFPAVQGYLRKPTIVNNVETLAAVKYIIRDGAAAYKAWHRKIAGQ
jgi:NADH:ubiquinone oxidoreductase subunit F (NADH-binding)